MPPPRSRHWRLELRDADGPQAYARVALQADSTISLMPFARHLAGQGRAEIVALAGDSSPPYRTW